MDEKGKPSEEYPYYIFLFETEFIQMGWTMHDIDTSDTFNLLNWYFRYRSAGNNSGSEKQPGNVKVINGKAYTRAKGMGSFM